jgi:hypothetical protein
VEPPHIPSPTAVAAEALRTGVVNPSGGTDRTEEIPGNDAVLGFGDPEVDPLRAAYVGDEVPGGDMPVPGTDRIDDVGRAYGVAEEDSGELVTAADLLTERDRRSHRR